ncbi:MAG: DUF4845 domain-containing protein [Burkholderiales bacterium]|nr:DUF4845 domain-containing protein [Burkholderiales bacterium]
MNRATKFKQQGLSVWGLLAVIFLAIIVIWIGIKVVPEYITASSVNSCLQDAYASGGGDYNRIKNNFIQCLNINAVYETGNYNLTMHGKTLNLEWKVLLPIAGNMSLLLEFSNQAPEY